jgi:hypothetical protein
MRHVHRAVVVAIALLLVSVPSHASLLLTFEGLQDQEDILSFYNGGSGSLGSTGPDLNIEFGASALAVIDADAGGGGNFANEPSPDTVGVFLGTDTVIMNVLDGFGDFFSFFYTSFVPITITVYGGVDGTGSILGSVSLPAQGTEFNGCEASGDPTGQFACWDPGSVSFLGIAHSVRYEGQGNFTGFDDIELGSVPDDPSVPEPGLVSLLGVGLAFIAARRRARG